MVAMRLCAMAVIRDYNDGTLMWPTAVETRGTQGRHHINDVESLAASDEEYFPSPNTVYFPLTMLPGAGSQTL